MTDATTPREASVFVLIPKGSTVGAVGATAGTLTHNDVMALGGFALAVLGFLVNLYFKWRQDRRDAVLHAAQVEAIKES